MSGVKRRVISLVLVVTLLMAICTVRPAPVYASSSSAETVAIILGGVIGGLAIIAIVFTLIVRNNPAWMPALPQDDAALKSNPWDQPAARVQFGWRCGVRGGAVPLICW